VGFLLGFGGEGGGAGPKFHGGNPSRNGQLPSLSAVASRPTVQAVTRTSRRADQCSDGLLLGSESSLKLLLFWKASRIAFQLPTEIFLAFQKRSPRSAITGT
jgi:hypothetical protein